MDQKNKTRAGRRGGIMCGGDDDNNNDLLFFLFVFDLLVKKNRDEEMYIYIIHVPILFFCYLFDINYSIRIVV